MACSIPTVKRHPRDGLLRYRCSRVVAAAIEQNHDKYGIIGQTHCTFQAAIVPMNMHKSERVQEAARKLYAELTAAGIEVLFDDRKDQVMFSDMELIGIPTLS